MRLIANKSGGEAVLHFTVSNTVIIAGNNTVSNVATSSETVTGALITQAFWGVGGAGTTDGYWKVERGANTVLILDQSGHVDYSASGVGIKLDYDQNLTVTLVNSTVGYLIIELQKVGSISNNNYLVG